MSGSLACLHSAVPRIELWLAASILAQRAGLSLWPIEQFQLSKWTMDGSAVRGYCGMRSDRTYLLRQEVSFDELCKHKRRGRV